MSTVQISKVAVAGGTGLIGKYIVQELVDQGFQVTLLSRSRPDNVPSGVAVKRIDYEDADSLQGALSGHDAVVSAVGSASVGAPQQKLADAAFAAGVRRFIPSEFGINTRKLQGTKIGQIIAGKTKLVDDLQNKSQQQPSFTWTGVSNGLFFDLNLEIGVFGWDAKAKKALVVDSGNEPFQTTNKGLIAKAVASILKRPQETANKYLCIASFQPTHNSMLQLVEELTGCKWNVEHQSTADLQKLGEEKLAKGDFSAFGPLLRVHLYRDGQGHALQEADKANKLLGLPEEDDLRETLRKWLTSAGAIKG